jgi:hypothetical protein
LIGANDSHGRQAGARNAGSIVGRRKSYRAQAEMLNPIFLLSAKTKRTVVGMSAFVLRKDRFPASLTMQVL